MDPISIIQSITLLGIVKLLIVLLLIVYAIFAGLMMKQIAAMTKAVTMKDDFIMRLLGAIHFGFAILVLLLALILL